MGFNLNKIHNIKELRAVFDRISFDGLKKLTPDDGVVEYFDRTPYLRPEFFYAYKQNNKRISITTLGSKNETFYSAEEDGDIFQWNIGAGGMAFDTYFPHMAVNKSLQKKGFVLGSYVYIETKDGGYCDIIMDEKEAAGWDSNKVDYFQYLEKNDGETFTRAIPRDCRYVRPSRQGHPLAMCYDKRVFITFEYSKQLHDGRPNDLKDPDRRSILFQPWALMFYIEKNNIDHDIEIPSVLPIRKSDADGAKSYYVSAMAYFADVDEANYFLEELCAPEKEIETQRDAADRAYIDEHFCRTAKIVTTSWPASANSVTYLDDPDTTVTAPLL